MATTDRRSRARVYKDGSSQIDVGLTTAQAEAVFGSGATAAWYRIGHMAGGNLGRETDNQKVYDENGEYVGTTGTRDEHVITNTSQQTDAETLKLFEWLETNAVPVRYILPTPDPAVVQVHYHPAMLADEARQVTTSKGIRTMQFALRGKKSDHAFADVAADESDWATSDVADAVDATFSPA